MPQPNALFARPSNPVRPPLHEVLASPRTPSAEAGAVPIDPAMPAPRAKRLDLDDLTSRRWRAVEARDRAADGSFVFAVATTGVYCRPSCPARRPKFENVSFFADGASARAAGFRSCKRCLPDETPAIERAIAATRRLLDEAEGEPVALAQLAHAVGLSPAHLQREFRRRLGLSPKQYAVAHRAARLRRELGRGRTVLDAGFEAGYGSASRMYDDAARTLGMSPSRFRSGGKGARIAFAHRPTPLGTLLLAATDRGLCAVRLAATPEAAQAALVEEFPRADLAENAESLAPYFAAIDALLDGQGPLPSLDIEATAFEATVWTALLAIPRGETRSYSEIATEIGRPSAVRAVARACAANPVAIVVPCHRVIGRDGALTGYRWGVERKRALLDLERKRPPAAP